MNVEKLFIADPNNKDHQKLFKDFENKYNTNIDVIKTLKNIDNKSDNIINQCLFLESKNEIQDYCFIYAEKDRKAATIEFANIDTKQKNRKLITLSTEYSFESLGMQLIVITASPDNKSLINNLTTKEFENLGEDNGKIVFMKEKELEKEQGMIRHGNN